MDKSVLQSEVEFDGHARSVEKYRSPSDTLAMERKGKTANLSGQALLEELMAALT